MNLLDLPPLRRVRQNHAVEHATITLLMAREYAPAMVAGRSDHRGFYVFGPVDTDLLAAAVNDALRRLQRGEAELAIHPNCGTNLVTTGAMAGLAAFAATTIGRLRHSSLLDRVLSAVLAATVAVIASRPVGLRLQRDVTTLADVGNLRIAAITRRQIGSGVIHWVQTSHD
ncbi:MAG: DUF6391 domain-containing protein [Anaerolineae bacterium]